MNKFRYKNINLSLAFNEFHSPLPAWFWGSAPYLKSYRRITGTDVGFFNIIRNSELTGYMESESSQRIAKSIQKKLTRVWLNAEFKKFEKHLKRLEKAVEQVRFENLNKPELIKLFELIHEKLGELYPYSNAFYMFSVELEKRLLQALQKKHSEAEAAQVLASLSIPHKQTSLLKYSSELLSLAKKIKHQHKTVNLVKLKQIYTKDRNFKKQIDKLKEKYFCLVSIKSKELTVDTIFLDLISKLSQKEQRITKRIVPKEIKEDLYFLSIMIYLKDELSSYVVPYIHFGLKKQWDAAAKALGLSRNDFDQLTITEVTKGLKNRQNYTKLVKDRKRLTIFFHKPYRPTQIFQGQAAEAEMKLIKKQASAVDRNATIRGKVGSPGKVVGRVRKILHSKDVSSFKKGRILVAVYTAPEFLPAMQRALGIVTDIGGITSHAAIVSRELGKPCIVDTKIATEALKDGDLIELDANKGTIKKL